MRIDASELKVKIKNALVAKGLSIDCSEATAECMVMADLFGIATHGSVVLPSHIKRIENGGYNLNPIYEVVSESSSYAIIDADNSIGFASASHCMRFAMSRAGENGMFTVFCRNANAYGAASCYAMMAAQRGMIGITCCNSPAAMAPIGGKDKLFGTNPLSVVIPTGDDEPIIVDMATSKVAKSKFLQMKREGKALGAGWALDKDGKPTIDPDEGIQGLVCPMEGFKGYGLALIIDVLAGVLSGAAWQDKVNRFYNAEGTAMNVGHLFIAINPEMIMGKCYWDIIKAYVANIRNSTKIDDGAIAVPGDDKHIARRQNLSDGIEISLETAYALGLLQ